MPFLKRFIKLMKDELSSSKTKNNFSWIIDESKCLNAQEVRKLRKTCRQARDYGLSHKNFTAVRNWFMVELGLNAGLRVEEMASLRLGNLLIEKNRSSIVVTGKGNKKRAVWISSFFKKECLDYLDYKKSFGYGIEADDYLLNNLKGNRISKRALQKFFKMFVKKAGLSGHYHIHCLRHTYTTFLLRAGNYNYRFAQQQLGHASIKTTQIYASVIDSEGRKAVESLYK
jgi:site-specific recombinase XerD